MIVSKILNMINDKEREDIKEQIFLTSVKNKTEVVRQQI